MTKISVSGKKKTGCNEFSFNFLFDQNYFNHYFRHPVNWIFLMFLKPYSFLYFTWIKSVFKNNLKITKLSITENFLNFYKRLGPNWMIFRYFSKIIVFVIKLSVGKWKLSIEIFLSRNKENIFSRNETFSNKYGSLFSELQSF